MARVCPHCQKLTADIEYFCPTCGNQTVAPSVWKQVREQKMPESAELRMPEKVAPEEISELNVKVGLGGMLAFFTFFVVYLAAYITWVA